MPFSKEMKTELQYAGAINLLAELSIHLRDNFEAEDNRECIERAIQDWCELSGWSYKRVLSRFELIPPQNKALTNT